MADENKVIKKEDSRKKNQRPVNKNYALKKRRFEGSNVIFVTKKSNFKVILGYIAIVNTKGSDYTKFPVIT